MNYLVVEPSGIEVKGLFIGFSKKRLISRMIYLKQGDHFHLENVCKYYRKKGWLILINVDEEQTFILSQSLQRWIDGEQIVQSREINKKIQELKTEIDIALDERNKEWFMNSSKKLKELIKL